MAASGDFYQILGVSPTASAADIQRAYRELARHYHPDVNSDPSAEDRFKEIGEAYEVLSDPEKRRRYDAFGPDFRRVPEGAGAGARGRRSTAGARTGERPGAGPRAGSTAGGPYDEFWFRSDGADVDLEDLFGGMFSGRRGWGPIPGADQEAQLELSLEDAYRGGRRSVTLSGPGGTRTYEVTIPAGVVDGQRIRLAGQGGQGTEGAAAGDLYLVVRIAPDPRYRVDGRDVTTTLPVSPWEAALGAEVTVPTPTGDKKLTIPAGTSSGRRLRMRGQGIPDPRGRPGDLYAEVRIMVPPEPSPEERRLFEELAAASTFNPRSSP
jgi:curved DNA-binding protein